MGFKDNYPILYSLHSKKISHTIAILKNSKIKEACNYLDLAIFNVFW